MSTVAIDLILPVVFLVYLPQRPNRDSAGYRFENAVIHAYRNPGDSKYYSSNLVEGLLLYRDKLEGYRV